MPGGKLVGIEHVGGGGVLSEKHTVRFVFYDFASLPHERGQSTKSSGLLCHGHKWSVRLRPGGSKNSTKDAVHISLHLFCDTAERDCEIKAKYALRVPAAGLERKGKRQGKVFSKNGFRWGCGWGDFSPRADILDPTKNFLVDGTLTIEADIQVFADKPSIWTPKNTLSADFLKILESADRTGDITFQASDDEFHAHRSILKFRAPELAALAEGYPPETPIPIQDIRPSIFRALLRFIYANDVPRSNNLRKNAPELLNVADRFGCTGLKLVAETELAASGISAETAAELILYADAKNCALLKEAAIEFFAANPTAVMASPGWTNVAQSAAVMNELMGVAFGKKRSAPAPADFDGRDYKRMCVSDLRRNLDEKGLDVDGSREMLIDRLEHHEKEDDVID